MKIVFSWLSFFDIFTPSNYENDATTFLRNHFYFLFFFMLHFRSRFAKCNTHICKRKNGRREIVCKNLRKN